MTTSNAFGTFTSPVIGGFAQPAYLQSASQGRTPAPLAPPSSQLFSVLELMVTALAQMQQGWGGLAAPTSAQPPASNSGVQAYASPPADLQRYIDAVDNSGGSTASDWASARWVNTRPAPVS